MYYNLVVENVQLQLSRNYVEVHWVELMLKYNLVEILFDYNLLVETLSNYNLAEDNSQFHT